MAVSTIWSEGARSGVTAGEGAGPAQSPGAERRGRGRKKGAGSWQPLILQEIADVALQRLFDVVFHAVPLLPGLRQAAGAAPAGQQVCALALESADVAGQFEVATDEGLLVVAAPAAVERGGELVEPFLRE